MPRAHPAGTPGARFRLRGCCRLRLLQQLLEDRDSEIEVAELLHVEVDELAQRGCRGKFIKRGQPLDDDVDHVIQGPHRELAGHRRDLDRHVVDVVALEQLAGSCEAVARLRVAQHGLAEQVQIEPDALLPQLREALVEPGRSRVDDKVTHHAPEHPARNRDDRPRDDRGKAAAQEDRGPQVPGQERRDVVAELFEVAAGHPEVFGAHHAVDEPDGELEALRIFQQSLPTGQRWHPVSRWRSRRASAARWRCSPRSGQARSGVSRWARAPARTSHKFKRGLCAFSAKVRTSVAYRGLKRQKYVLSRLAGLRRRERSLADALQRARP